MNYTGSFSLAFKNEVFLKELNAKIIIKEREFNLSYNPTLQSGSLGDLKSFATGSYFKPYITTIGLYNDNNELLAVAKLGQPLEVSNIIDTNIMIRLDI
jgi:hypothetical protein